MAIENDTTPECCPALTAFLKLQGAAFRTAAALKVLAELLEGVDPPADQEEATVNAEGIACLLRPIHEQLEAAACENEPGMWQSSPCHDPASQGGLDHERA